MATIIQIANADRNLSSFSKALKISGLEDQLNEMGPFTILGPVNLAFERLSLSFEELLSPVNKQHLVTLLSNHILLGKTMQTDFSNGRKFRSINGNEISVNTVNGELKINGAKILAKDRQGKNGVVHTLDSVYSLP
jgi:uncharacterized surface protein with fasciclin (FAS1) repeats